MILRCALCVVALLLWVSGASHGIVAVQEPKAAPGARSARIAFVPLDDRPSSLQYPLMLADIADAELVMPPRIALGRYLKTGDGDAVAQWLDVLDLSSLDAVVVSADMLAYGGLIGSRVPRVLEADARRRLGSIAGLKRRRADLPVLAFSTILRLAPTADGSNEGWRKKLARWAEISVGADAEPALASERAELERGLPAGMIERYRQTRARNRAVTLSLVDMLGRDAVDFLAVAQDETAPRGVHVADRDAIRDAIVSSDLVARATMDVGPGEAGMLLLARAFAARSSRAPAVAVTYSPAAAGETAAPSEGRPLAQVVAAHLAAAGATLDARPQASDLRLYVYASRHDSPDEAAPFARRIAAAVTAGQRVIVVDIDMQGDTPGASLPFTAALRNARVLARLAGYSASNAGGSAIGTAVSQGIIYAVALDQAVPRSRDAARRVGLAQTKFLLHRLINDFIYEAVARPQAFGDLLQPKGMDPLRLDESQQLRVEKYLNDEVQPLADSLVADFASPWRVPGTRRTPPLFTVRDMRDFRLHLPWGRMAEADIDFALVTD
jgi:Protein of unknown function (DUF4127)